MQAAAEEARLTAAIAAVMESAGVTRITITDEVRANFDHTKFRWYRDGARMATHVEYKHTEPDHEALATKAPRKVRRRSKAAEALWPTVPTTRSSVDAPSRAGTPTNKQQPSSKQYVQHNLELERCPEGHPLCTGHKRSLRRHVHTIPQRMADRQCSIMKCCCLYEGHPGACVTSTDYADDSYIINI